MLAEQAVAITLSIVCAATFITSLEQLARFRELKPFFAPNLDQRPTARHAQIVVALLIARAILGPSVIASLILLSSPVVPLGLLAIVSSAFTFHRPVGGDGADQFQAITIMACFLCYLLAPTEAAHWAALYLCFQLLLAYTTTGWSKLMSPVWRQGDVVQKIFSTYSYGHPQVSAVLSKSHRLNMAATWGPIALFSLTPLFFLQPTMSGIVAFLGLAFAFHLGTGLVMGLNNFVITFPASYPCVVYAHSYLHGYALPGLLHWA